MLKSVHFEGLKSLVNVTLELSPLTVLVGPNGCGKTTVLDQIDTLTSCATQTGKGHSLGGAGLVLEASNRQALATQGASPVKALWQGSTGAGSEFRVEVAELTSAAWFMTAQVTATTAGGIASLPGTATTADIRNFEATHLDLLPRAQRLALNPRSIAEPVDVREATLEADGFGLAAVLGRLLRRDRAAFDAVEADMRKVVPHFLSLVLADVEVNAGAKGESVGGLEIQMRVVGDRLIPASGCSDGMLLALALLTAAHNRDAPTLILMDDIDHGLHLGAQLAMLQAIRSVMSVRPDLQIICTTHSPYFLHAAEVEEVRVLALTAEGHTVAKPLTEHPDVAKWRAAMSAGELWANLGEDWVHER